MNDQSTTERIAELKKLAEAVTQWSNCNQAWLDSSEDTPAATVGHIDEDGSTYPVAVIDCDQYYAAQDSIKLAKFYAAANPQAILSLIKRIAELEKSLQAIKAPDGYCWELVVDYKWHGGSSNAGTAEECGAAIAAMGKLHISAAHQNEDKA